MLVPPHFQEHPSEEQTGFDQVLRDFYHFLTFARCSVTFALSVE
jgi:hypothetical protein